METPLLDRISKMGHVVFTRGDLNLNIIGIRSRVTKAGKFDDLLAVSYKLGGAWVENYFRVTTDPGAYYLGERKNWLNSKGVAIMAPGQYRGAYRIGPKTSGGNVYDALVQGKPVKVFRDADLDLDLDFVNPEIGMFGMDIHASSSSPETKATDRTDGDVGPWSGGCAVFARDIDFRQFMGLVKGSANLYGPNFTYTLVTEDELGV